MSENNKNSTGYRQTSIMEFIDNIATAQQTKQPINQSNIIQFTTRKLSKKRAQALKRVISYSESLNW